MEESPIACAVKRDSTALEESPDSQGCEIAHGLKRVYAKIWRNAGRSSSVPEPGPTHPLSQAGYYKSLGKCR